MRNYRFPSLLVSACVAFAIPTAFASKGGSPVFPLGCLQAFVARLPEIKGPLWERDTPLAITGWKTKKPLNLTFSNDTEFPMYTAYRLLQSDSADFAKFKKLADDVVGTISLKEGAEILNMSPKQFQTFALRKGVDPNLPVFSLTDLNAHHFALMCDVLNDKGPWHLLQSMVGKLTPQMQRIFERKGFPVEVIQEGYFFEIRHASHESRPKAFKDYLVGLHDEIADAETHLHLGLPAAAISNDEAWSIARAVETKVTLGILQRYEDMDALPVAPTLFGSPLSRKSNRGFVFLKLEEFKTPVLSHDLEIRQFDDLDHGMNLLETATNLAVQHDKLKLHLDNFGPPSSAGSVPQNEKAGNISGALGYAAAVLRNSPDSKLREISRKLHALHKEALPHPEQLPKGLWKKIHTFLRTNDVVGLLNDKVFIKLETSLRPFQRPETFPKF